MGASINGENVTWIDYDESFDPPALTATVVISNPVTAIYHTLRGKLDTGADITVFPAGLVNDLRLQQAGEQNVRGSLDERDRVPSYFINLQFCGHKFEYVEAVVSNFRYDILLGRDLLNSKELTANGPALQFRLL